MRTTFEEVKRARAHFDLSIFCLSRGLGFAFTFQKKPHHCFLQVEDRFLNVHNNMYFI